MREWKRALADVVPHRAAPFAVDAWEGALIAAKLEGSRTPLERALEQLRELATDQG